MDQGSIQSGRIVERYLAGDLLVREAREFERYCLEHPEILKELPIPVRLKARLSRRPLEESETGMFPAIPSSAMHAAARVDGHDEDDDDEDEDRVRSPAPHRRTVQTLGIGLLLAAIGLAVYAWRSHTQETQIKTLRVQAKALQIRAPASLQTFKVQPSRSPSGGSLSLGWPDPPKLFELHIDVTESKFTLYQITIDKEGEARVIQIRRISRDSNNELRLGLNSSAFGPGVYQMQLEGYNWRGELTPVGWVNLKLE
jgi:hypothetical protein